MNKKRLLLLTTLAIPTSGLIIAPITSNLITNKNEISINQNQKSLEKYNLIDSKIAIRYYTFPIVHFYVNAEQDKLIAKNYPNIQRKLVVWIRNKNSNGDWGVIRGGKPFNVSEEYIKDGYNGYWIDFSEFNNANWDYEFELEYENNSNIVASIRMDLNSNFIKMRNPDGSITNGNTINKLSHFHDYKNSKIEIKKLGETYRKISLHTDIKQFQIMNYYHKKIKNVFTIWEKEKGKNENWISKTEVQLPVKNSTYFIGFVEGYLTFEIYSPEWYDYKYDYEFSLEFFDITENNDKNNPISMVRMDSTSKVLKTESFDGDKMLDNDYETDKSLQNIEKQTLIISLSIAIPLFIILSTVLIVTIVLFNRRNKNKLPIKLK